MRSFYINYRSIRCYLFKKSEFRIEIQLYPHDDPDDPKMSNNDSYFMTHDSCLVLTNEQMDTL